MHMLQRSCNTRIMSSRHAQVVEVKAMGAHDVCWRKMKNMRLPASAWPRMSSVPCSHHNCFSMSR